MCVGWSLIYRVKHFFILEEIFGFDMRNSVSSALSNHQISNHLWLYTFASLRLPISISAIAKISHEFGWVSMSSCLSIVVRALHLNLPPSFIFVNQCDVLVLSDRSFTPLRLHLRLRLLIFGNHLFVKEGHQEFIFWKIILHFFFFTFWDSLFCHAFFVLFKGRNLGRSFETHRYLRHRRLNKLPWVILSCNLIRWGSQLAAQKTFLNLSGWAFACESVSIQFLCFQLVPLIFSTHRSATVWNNQRSDPLISMTPMHRSLLAHMNPCSFHLVPL